MSDLMDRLNTDNPDPRTAEGNTPMADAIALAVDGLELRKKAYRAAGIEYQRPWLVLMTDGIPTDDQRYFDETVAHLNDIERKRGITVFPIAIGKHTDLAVLARTSVEREPVRMRDVASFTEFFVWLAAGLSVTSQSGAGQQRLPPLTGWASV